MVKILNMQVMVKGKVYVDGNRRRYRLIDNIANEFT